MAISSDEFKKRLAEQKAKREQQKNGATPEPPRREIPPDLQPTSGWSGEKRTRSKALVVRQDKMPPHSVEAEQGVLGSILVDCQRGSTKAISEVAGQIAPDFFFVPAHKTIYESFISLWTSGIAIDLISFTQILRDQNKLDSVGGAAAVTNLFTFVPTAANVVFYMDIMREKYLLRQTIALATHMVRSAYGEPDVDAVQLLDKFSFRLTRIKQEIAGQNGAEKFNLGLLGSFDAKHDPDILIGGQRWVVRGGTSLWAGGSGIGKSSLIIQLSMYWACGQKCFGLRPVRKLKSLIIQAENDLGDTAEQFQGVRAGILSTGDIGEDELNECITKNISIFRVIGKSGMTFLSLLESLIEQERPQIVWVDPLFAFAGCDLLDADKTGRFIRDGLIPIAAKSGVAMHVMHHIGKPKGEQEVEDARAVIEYQYLGFGSCEIPNSFRAVNVLMPCRGSHVFKLVLSKRGERALARDADDKITQTIFLEHSHDGICWLQTTEPPKKGKSRFNEEHILQHMSIVVPIKVKDLLKLVRDPEHGKMSDASFFRLWDELQAAKKVKKVDDGWIKNSQHSQDSQTAA